MKTNHGRIDSLRGKKIWILKTEEGKVIDKFITKGVALRTKRYYKKNYFMDLIIEKEGGSI